MTCVLLTGATGFLGRQILLELSSLDARIRLVVRSGSEKQIPEHISTDVIITQDMFRESTDWWENVCNGVDIVIHAAWSMKYEEYVDSVDNFFCLEGSLNLARGAVQSGVRKFVGIGTCAEYNPIHGYLSVTTPLKPSNLYSSSKVALFNMLDSWLPSQNVDFIWARIFNLYGENENPNRLVSYVHNRLKSGQIAELSDGSLIRDYLDVGVAGKDIVSLALSDQIGPFNICSGEPKTIREIAEAIADEYQSRELLRFNSQKKYRFDAPCIVGIKNY